MGDRSGPAWFREVCADSLGIVVVLGILVIAAAQAIFYSNVLFDDAFITYRYADNLAHGHGLVWNFGEPTEGYSNFLFVVMLAPFIRLGANPLGAARVMSALALFGLTAMFYRHARQSVGASRFSAFVLAMPFLILAKGAYLLMLGLETIVYTLALLVGFLWFLRYLDEQQPRHLALFALSQLAAFLLRAEGVLLTGAVVLFIVWTWWTGRSRWTAGDARRLWIPLALLIVPIGAYLLWKYWYFGALLPNPFYIKVSDGAGLSRLGLGSIADYLAYNKLLVGIALLSALVFFRERRSAFTLILIFVGMYLAFFAFVDTLMDFASRFIYPLTPFLYLLALPALLRAYEFVKQLRTPLIPKAALAGIVIYLLSPNVIGDMADAVDRIANWDAPDSRYEMVQKRWEVGTRLAEYPDIENVTLAIGDAGIVPYLAGARVIDLVGLNDRYIATTRDYDQLVDYVFSQNITLMFHATTKDSAYSPITYGHGWLGKMERWVHREGAKWEDYEYVGSVRTSTARGHQYHLLLKRDYPRFEEFKTFLQQGVIDVFYDDFVPPGGTPPTTD